MSKQPREDQFSGCLIGQALGDALGFPVEGYPRQVCAKYVDQYLRSGRVEDVGRGGMSSGQYTDDTQLARELLISLVERKGFEPADYASRIALIFNENRIVGRGRATEEAARRLISGVCWENAGTPSPSAGNGSAMRAAPVGMFFYGEEESVIRAAHDQGRITHQDSRCSAGAVVVAGAVALGLQLESIDSQQFLETLSDWAATYDDSAALLYQQLVEWISLPPDQAADLISHAGLGAGSKDDWEGITPFVTSSVMWSLYSFLRTPEDYWETICTAIAVGGDVDTTAAMAGAMSGAYNGLAQIPQEMACRVNDRDSWGYKELMALSQQCYSLKLNR